MIWQENNELYKTSSEVFSKTMRMGSRIVTSHSDFYSWSKSHANHDVFNVVFKLENYRTI